MFVVLAHARVVAGHGAVAAGRRGRGDLGRAGRAGGRPRAPGDRRPGEGVGVDGPWVVAADEHPAGAGAGALHRPRPPCSAATPSLIHNAARGYPRAVNKLAINTLTAAFARNQAIVDEKSARAAIAETGGD